jgi:transposase
MDAIAAFHGELAKHNGDAERIELLSMDMKPAFIAGAHRYFPKAEVVLDHFHVMQMVGKAVDQVRKQLAWEGAQIKGSLWAIRGNSWTRSSSQMEKRQQLCNAYPKLARALGLRDLLQDILSEEDPEMLTWWCQRASRSRLESFVKLFRSIKAYWNGVVAFMRTRLTNGAMEAINGLLQLAKRLARGFRSVRYFRIMAYFKAGKLQLDLPQFRSSPTHSK